jgi:hypothetical protein
MKLFPFTWWIVSYGALIHGFFGLLMVLKLPDRTWQHWIDIFGGMVLDGALCGLALALLAAGLRYLYMTFSRFGQQRIPQRIYPA